ncbi:MAG: hypothetical protein QOH03_4499, partial [Kribbellaceae bacterium]|nr:hypothetical protein [Kribbellaceae bacterium]
MPPSAEAGRLAKRLRGLRDSPDVTLTQSQLAKAFSHDSRVAIATISSWESKTNPKLPPAERLRSYALLFSTDRTNPDGTPKMVSERELTADERERFDELHEELLGLRDAVRLQSSGTSSSVGGNFTWDFENGPITIICPEAPIGERLDLADEKDPNYTRMYRYADLDALMELWGHLRASNPELQVYHRLPSEVKADDMSSHLVLLGGIGWNHVTRRLLKTLREMPISQFEVSDLKTGEIFKASGAGGKEFRPVFEEGEDGPE